MTEIFFIDCSGLLQYADTVIRYLSPFEQERLSHIKDDGMRICSAVSRFILLNALHLPYSTDFSYGIHGKPYIDGYHFSISHTGNIVCISISDSETGIDIERPRDNTGRIAEKYFDESEKEYLLNCPGGFTRVWTLKEATVKLFGAGLSMDISSFSVYPFDSQHLINGRYVSFHCGRIYGMPFSSATFREDEQYTLTEITTDDFLKELNK